jgi:hypothetical protein
MKEIISTVIISVILAAVLAIIVVKLIKNKRAGKSSCGCGCGCSGCAMKDICHSQPAKEKASEEESSASSKNQ